MKWRRHRRRNRGKEAALPRRRFRRDSRTTIATGIPQLCRRPHRLQLLRQPAIPIFAVRLRRRRNDFTLLALWIWLWRRHVRRRHVWRRRHVRWKSIWWYGWYGRHGRHGWHVRRHGRSHGRSQWPESDPDLQSEHTNHLPAHREHCRGFWWIRSDA